MAKTISAWIKDDVIYQIRKSHRWFKAVQIKDGKRRCFGIGATKPSKKEVERWFNEQGN